MKISKLFHWLYASLMLLPLMVFGVTGLYYGLNQSAQLSERTEQQPIYYQSNELESASDLIVGNAYKWNDNYLQNSNLVNAKFFIDYRYVEEQFGLENISTNISDTYFATNDTGSANPYLWYRNSNNALTYISLKNTAIYFVVSAIDNTTANIPNEVIEHIEPYNDLFKEYQPIVYNNDISTSIINAWNSTWQNPLFSWSSDSFLIAPFNYITDLFSIPQNNTFSMALSYWLAISIVYLVFDLVMYVPLLAHRWIDKGMVE